MEKCSEVSVRGSKFTVNGSIQAEAACWPQRGLLTLTLSHGMVAGVATVPPTDLILLFPIGLPDPQTDSIDDDEEDYDDIGAA